MSPGQSEPSAAPDSRVSFFPAWCKRCGNCVAFCPRGALGRDQWDHPTLAHPERCTACGLCEMLCPDFAISVGGAEGPPEAAPVPGPAAPGRPAPPASPERLAPEPAALGEGNGDGPPAKGGASHG